MPLTRSQKQSRKSAVPAALRANKSTENTLTPRSKRDDAGPSASTSTTKRRRVAKDKAAKKLHTGPIGEQLEALSREHKKKFDAVKNGRYTGDDDEQLDVEVLSVMRHGPLATVRCGVLVHNRVSSEAEIVFNTDTNKVDLSKRARLIIHSPWHELNVDGPPVRTDCVMYLKYYENEDGERVYTLKNRSPEGAPTLSAHPARFSPDDKVSRERVTFKKRFSILPTMLPPYEY